MNEASYYLGFGWIPLTSCLLLGFATYYYSDGWLHWVLYFLFVIMLAYMATKFRLYSREPWRRVHSRGVGVYKQVWQSEDERARKEGREFDAGRLYSEFAQNLSVTSEDLQANNGGSLLDDPERKAYYYRLVEEYPVVFTQRIKPEFHAEAIERIKKDINVSELGPDIIIAVAIAKTYSRLEAARYLLALATGVTMRKGLFA